MSQKQQTNSRFGLEALKRAAAGTAPKMGNAGPGTKPLPYRPGKGFKMGGGK